MKDGLKMPDLCNRRNPLHYTTALNILSKMDLDVNRIGIMAVGRYENYKGEVIGQKPVAGTAIDADTKIWLKIGYSSAVDYMPYQFFYGLGTRVSAGSEWELRARTLMAPFDSSVIRSEARSRLVSLVFGLGLVDREHIERFLSLYDFDLGEETEDVSELLFWSSLLPSFNHWSGNPDYVARVITSIFGYECRIVENVRSTYDIPEQLRYRLGSESGRLGSDTLIGKSFSECDTTYEVVLLDVRRADLPGFLPGRSMMRKLEKVIGFCMPGNLECRVRIVGERHETRIGREEASCYLGHSSYV
jgi:hypothetical protein